MSIFKGPLGVLDGETWTGYLVRVGSLRYRALKKTRWVEEWLRFLAGPSVIQWHCVFEVKKVNPSR